MMHSALEILIRDLWKIISLLHKLKSSTFPEEEKIAAALASLLLTEKSDSSAKTLPAATISKWKSARAIDLYFKTKGAGLKHTTKITKHNHPSIILFVIQRLFNLRWRMLDTNKPAQYKDKIQPARITFQRRILPG